MTSNTRLTVSRFFDVDHLLSPHGVAIGGQMAASLSVATPHMFSLRVSLEANTRLTYQIMLTRSCQLGAKALHQDFAMLYRLPGGWL